MSGEGGDELFGGYERYKKLLMVQRWRMIPKKIRSIISELIKINNTDLKFETNIILSLVKKFSIMNKQSLKKTDSELYKTFMTLMSSGEKKLIFSNQLKYKINRNNNKKYIDVFDDVFASNQHKSILENAQIIDFKKYLHDDILVKVDRMSMANSLEVRSPLLDYRIIELAFSLPDYLKINKNNTKYILRESMKNLIPREIYMRKDKRGFSVPISEWIRNELSEYVNDTILDKSILELGLFNKNQIEKMLVLHNKRLFDYGPQIWSIFIMSLWMKNNNFSL